MATGRRYIGAFLRKAVAVLCAVLLVVALPGMPFASGAWADDTPPDGTPETEKPAVDPATCDHQWDEGHSTVQPSCAGPGVMTFTCSKCGTTKTENVPALEHQWGDWQVITPAEPGKEGLEGRFCTTCGEPGETRVVAALPEGGGGEPSITYTLEDVQVDGLYEIDEGDSFVEGTRQEPVSARIDEKGGQLRIRLKETLVGSDGSKKTVLQGEDGWVEVNAKFTSRNASKVAVDEAKGIVTAKADADAGVSIDVAVTYGSNTFDLFANVYTAHQEDDVTGEQGGSGTGGQGGSGTDDQGGWGEGGEGGQGGMPGDSSDSPVEIPDIPTEVTNPLVYSIAVAYLYPTDAYGQWLKQDPQTPASPPVIREQNGKLRIMLKQVERKKAKTYYQSDDRWITVNQRYYSSNPSLISVDNDGVLTAHKNAKDGVVIYVFGDGGLFTSVVVYAENQDDSDVDSIFILDENGNDVTGAKLLMGKADKEGAEGASPSSAGDDESRYRQYYARVLFVDGTTSSTLPSAPDYDGLRAEPRLNGGRLTWKVNNEDVGYVNPETGRFKALDDGMVKVEATYANTSGYVWIQMNTGKYADAYNPSDSLTIKICYEMDEGKVYSSKTYSVGEVSSWGLITENYTLTQANGKYVSDRASGVPLTTVCEQAGVKVDEVTGFRFVANDGANPGFVSRSMLFDTTRYCFPNYDLGGSFQGAYAVPALLAIADSWTPNAVAGPDDELNPGTCFRLVFGSTGRSDGLTSKSLKYINTLIIVLEGAAPTGSGEGEGEGYGTETGDGDTGEGAGAIGMLDNDDADATSANPPRSGVGYDEAPAVFSPVPVDSIVFEEANVDEQQEGEEAAEGGARWQVYEMMARRESQFEKTELEDAENVLAPYALPSLVLVGLFGAGVTVGGYRRQVVRPTAAGFAAEPAREGE